MRTDDNPQYLSTPQAAAALGVSVSTVKRWVDEGTLPAYRTAGGHRKLLRAELLALARQGNLPHGDLAALTVLSSKQSAVNPGVVAVDLANAVLDGQGAEVSAIIGGLYGSGMAVEAIADHVIAPALAAVGHDWEAGKIDVWKEHRGTQLCTAALYHLKQDLDARAEKSRPLAIGGAPEGDPYLLPSLLAHYVLLDSGWEAINLGADTPFASLVKALEELCPRLLWLSVSYVANTATFIERYKELYRVAERQGVAVAVGGQALHESLRSAIPYTTYGDGLTHLAAFARTLHPRPKRPRRGRPRKH